MVIKIFFFFFKLTFRLKTINKEDCETIKLDLVYHSLLFSQDITSRLRSINKEYCETIKINSAHHSCKPFIIHFRVH